jgi:hypothetical protein
MLRAHQQEKSEDSVPSHASEFPQEKNLLA